MEFGDLLELYVLRGNALQWLWTLYVLVIGGLLAFSTLRQKPDMVGTTLVSVLYICFAYKNLGAISALIAEREVIMAALRSYSVTAELTAILDAQQPTVAAGARSFHIACDLLTVAAVWAMEWRRRRHVARDPQPQPA